ncbi:MAG: alpha/beta hydrolase, partial [Bacteroidota bacterium]|nr:alpha/beta hydrolase [Bacteroidota bacterium]
HTAIEIALRHPEKIGKIILASAFYKRSAAVQQFWDGFEGATLDVMPQVLKDGYLLANNDPAGLLNMFNKDVLRMKGFKGWTDEQMQSIKAPTLVINGSTDIGSLEHAIEMYRIIPESQLAILPGGHGDYLGAIEAIQNGEWTQSYTADLIEEFLDK